VNALAPYYDRAAGQVIFRGPPVGMAGEASIEPVPGLQLTFDAADGRLCWAMADTAGDRPVAFDPRVAAMLTRLFGPHAVDVALAAVDSLGDTAVVCPEPGLAGTLSALARLQVAQVTSPVSANSPWWAAEAAGLAERAGLARQAVTLSGQALPGLLRLFDSPAGPALPEQAFRVARKVAESCAATHPEAASRLLTVLSEILSHPPLARYAAPRQGKSLNVAGEVTLMREDRLRSDGPQWLLDPVCIPAGVFQFGLSPWSDLFVRRKAGQAGIVVVIATLAPDVDLDALSPCVARLVDPPARRIVAQGSFLAAGSLAIAELELKVPLEECPESWVEIAGDRQHPVRTAKGHWTRRARRWADAALRAERAPKGIDSCAAPEDWAALAAASWDRCRQDWTNAGDPGRARMAASRHAAVDARTRDPGATATAAEPGACQAAADGPRCLAEVIGDGLR
jgi:hypothetical protein